MNALLDRSPIPKMSSSSWPALGSTATVCAPSEHLFAACEEVKRVAAAVDRLASRFRPDSELAVVNQASGRWTGISPELAELALWAADVSDGAVDPTLGEQLRWLGYDRDYTALSSVGPSTGFESCPPAGSDERRQPWRRIQLDLQAPAIWIPPEVSLDLGAVGKGHAADQAVQAAHAQTGGPVLVSLGGDIAVAGEPPASGWAVGIAADHRRSAVGCEQAVYIRSGGLATSSLMARRWWQGDRAVHHVLDPRDGLPVAPYWVIASVAAATCAQANVAATASLVLGPTAPQWLDRQHLPARLVALDGSVSQIGSWPA